MVQSDGVCDEGVCGSASVNVIAAQDFIDDPETENQVEIKVTSDSSREWLDYHIKPVRVSVESITTSRCQVFTDPHIITFDQARYDFFTTGTFLLHKSLDGVHETHVRFWDCSNMGGRRVSCVCGFVAREENDLISVDMCNGQYGETIPQVSIRNINNRKIKTRIHEARQGKILKVSCCTIIGHDH